MFKILRLFWLFAFLFSLGISKGQEGTPLSTNFSFGESSIDNESWAMAQDQNGQMLFANRRGIVTYDGVKWSTIPTPAIPLALYFDGTTSKIFVGCKNDIGFLQKLKNGTYKYVSLNLGRKNFGSIQHISSMEGYIFFYSEDMLTRYSVKEKQIKQWPAAPGEPFTGFLLNKDDVYLNIDKLGLHLVKENLLKPIKGGERFSNQQILFYFRLNRAQSVLGLDNDSLLLFNGDLIAPFNIESYDYIKENILSGGLSVDANTFVLSTITGGCLVIDKKTRKSIYTLNYQTGLPDDEVYALGLDRNKGLWVLHEFGMTRVDLKLPVRNINHYPGLEGNLTSILEKDSTIFVSTSEGVYYLAEVKNYAEIEVLVKVNDVKAERKKDEIESQEQQSSNQMKREAKEETNAKKKKGFIRKLFGKKKKKELKQSKNESDLEQESLKAETEQTSGTDSKKNRKKEKSGSIQNTVVNKKRTYALQSISHRFNKIDGIEGKVRQFITYQDKILVAANTGLYEIYGKEAFPIIEDRYVNYIHASKITPSKFYIGTSDGMLIVQYENDEWEVMDNLSEFREDVYSILELDKSTVWVGSENVAYKIILDKNGHPINIKAYSIKSDFTERVLVRNVFNIPYFFLSTGLYSYNAEKDSVVYNTKTNKGFTGQSKYIFSQDNITWVFNEFKWISMHEMTKYSALPESFLELFNNISNIYVDSKNNIWVIENNNSIYKIINTRKDYEEIFDIYLRFINGKDGELLSLSDLVLDYEQNSLSFHISAPYFVRSNGIEFQYHVEGLTPSWSEWRKDIAIDFPYIPDGEYTLQVRARNILGKETTIKTFHFEIVAPYWKSWWFYVLAVMVLGGTIVGVVRWREKHLIRKQKALEDQILVRTKQLRSEQAKTEELLLNILPAETAVELKKYGKAKARHYNFASVMFTDFKGFTQFAEQVSSTDLVQEIDYCFANFDDIIGKYGLEKIKTIGDAYMCAAGIPKEHPNNPVLLVLAAMEIAQFMETYKKEKRSKKMPFFELRLGIHSGPLVTGVVGKKKFAYDVWGDTVNTAARMESSGEPGMINISEATFKVVEPYFKCEFRGKIEAKNKGKIAMYFVKGIHKKYAANEEGTIPNEDLLKVLNLL